MFYSRLSMLQEILSEDEIKKLDEFFASLVGDAKNNITLSKATKATELSMNSVSKAFLKCKEKDILKMNYALRCPVCGILIERVDSIAEIPDGNMECYGCDNIVTFSAEDIEVLFSIVDNSVFKVGQQYCDTARSVVLEDTMDNMLLAGGINEVLFSPSEEEYNELLVKYMELKDRTKTSKQLGDSLEELVIQLFNLCSVFRAAGISTSNNQIDCCVRNKMFMKYGIFETIGEHFYIECKNEKRTPSGSYMSKLDSIITDANAGGGSECIKFGIIISNENGPRTFRSLAQKYYLSKKISIIAICGKELEELLKNRGNLLELIERKLAELRMDAITDLVAAGLYDI